MVARSTSIAEAREQLPTLVHQAELGAPTTLTRRGKPVAVLVSTSAYARLTGIRQRTLPFFPSATMSE